MSLSWKQRQELKLPKPRVIKAMSPHRMKPYCKAALGKTSGRTKYDPRSDMKSKMFLMGRKIQFDFIERGISLNRRKHYITNLAASIRGALFG